jgi:hypothetical protein
MEKAKLAGILALAISAAHADTRRFTYNYEPETLPQGGMEFEQWVTLRTGRNSTVGQQNYNAWDIREELEYGVTDRYSVSLYLNGKSESFRDPTANNDFSKFSFEGVSIENRYMVLNPAEHAVGFTLYLEPRFSGEEAELEQKLILGQRYGKWKWAFNLTHATEWKENLHETEGEVEGSIGVSYDVGKNWSIGIEARDHNEIPEYKVWENTAVFVGPTVSYRHDNWWVALSVMPQVYGLNFDGDPDGNSRLELEGHERVDVRLIFSIGF